MTKDTKGARSAGAPAERLTIHRARVYFDPRPNRLHRAAPIEQPDEARETLLGYIRGLVAMRETMNPGARLRFKCIEEMILKHGRWYQPFTLASPLRPGRLGRCYQNAFRAVAERRPGEPRFFYVEGLALPLAVPVAVPHAWVVDEQGRAYDPTWHGKQGARSAQPGLAYVGFTFKSEYVYRICAEQERYGVIDCPSLKFPLLTGRHRIEDVTLDLGGEGVSLCHP